MKKFLVTFLVMLNVLSTIGCSNVANSEVLNNKDKETNGEKNFVENGSIGQNDENSSLIEPPPYEEEPDKTDSYMFEFSSPQELLTSLNNNEKGVNIRENSKECSEMYNDMIGRFEDGEIVLKSPVLEGYDEDFLTSDVVLFTSEAFGMPWIWYRRWYDDKIMVVQISYLSDDLLEYSSNHSVWDVVMYVQPTAPSIEEMGQREEIKTIEEQTVVSDQGEIRVLFLETSAYDRVYLTFIVDDMMVRVFGSSEDVDLDLIKKLSFVEVK